MQPKYLKIPDTAEKWRKVAKEFRELWHYPNCLGSLDGKHITIQRPNKTGIDFRNYKGRYSIVLLALVDAHLNFLYVDAGSNGRCSDGGVFAKSTLKPILEGDHLNMPSADLVPETEVTLPYVIVADDAFPLTTRLMKPYPGVEIPLEQRIHNYRLSRARRTVENAFGVLTSKFRIFRTEIDAKIDTIKFMTLAACVLHNFLRQSGTDYIEAGLCDTEDVNSRTFVEGSWRSDHVPIPLQNRGGRDSNVGVAVREKFKHFFNNSGAVSWQTAILMRH